MCLIGVFPGVIAFGIPLPFDEVLELSRLPLTSVALDCFNFKLLFSINQVRWGLREVGAV